MTLTITTKKKKLDKFFASSIRSGFVVTSSSHYYYYFVKSRRPISRKRYRVTEYRDTHTHRESRKDVVEHWRLYQLQTSLRRGVLISPVQHTYHTCYQSSAATIRISKYILASRLFHPPFHLKPSPYILPSRVSRVSRPRNVPQGDKRTPYLYSSMALYQL